jgi:hypothetical protein
LSLARSSPEFHLPSPLAGELFMPDSTWQELYKAAIVEFDLARLPERVQAAYQGTKGSSAKERDEIDDALRVLFTLMQRAA